MAGSLRCRIGLHTWADSTAEPSIWGRTAAPTAVCARCERLRTGRTAVGRLGCAVGAHDWVQRDDPHGIAHGPVAVYSQCSRCEKVKRDEISAGPSAPEHPGRDGRSHW